MGARVLTLLAIHFQLLSSDRASIIQIVVTFGLPTAANLLPSHQKGDAGPPSRSAKSFSRTSSRTRTRPTSRPALAAGAGAW